MDPAVVDNIIERLIEVRLAKPGKLVQLTESEIKQLCVASLDIFMRQPNLLELEAPIKICGTLNLCVCVFISRYSMSWKLELFDYLNF